MNDPRTLSDNKHYPTTNAIRQRALYKRYPTTNISRQGKWSDKEHLKNVIKERTLSGKESYPTTRPTTVSKSTESFFSLISSEIFVPTSAGRISIRVLQASFRIRLSWAKTRSIWFGQYGKFGFRFRKSLIWASLSISRTNCSRDSPVAGIKQFEMKPTFKTAFFFSVFSATLAFCPNGAVLRGVVIAGF